MPAKKKDKTPGEKPQESTSRDSWSKELADAKKRIKSIHSVNGKFRAQLVKKKEGGWICELWEENVGGRDRPLTRNVKPFETVEQAVQMAQKFFVQATGDERYITNVDIWNWEEG